MRSTALLTDEYELTMLDAALQSGTAAHRAVFELFARDLPPGRRFGVVAGMGRVGDAVAEFRFDAEALDFLSARAVVGPEALEWLRQYRFSGDIAGYAEGDTYFPGSPVLRVESSFGEAVLLETLLLSILNHDCAIASSAARVGVAAAPRGAHLVEMGGRRTHESAAVDAARAAYVAGFNSTSNLEAGRRYGIPTAGTTAHAFVLVHRDELEAFVAQLRALGTDTTLLVDTYDTEDGIRNAVKAARELGYASPGAIRIDSGNLPEEARRARVLLDELGAGATRIVVSGDLDEFAIDALERDPVGAPPIDAYGVGTSIATGSGHPTAGFVYKLVAIADANGAPLRPVAKRSVGKGTIGGRKVAFRELDASGTAIAERFRFDERLPHGARPLQQPVVTSGEPVEQPSLDAVRAGHRACRAELPPGALDLAPGPPALHATSDVGIQAP